MNISPYFYVAVISLRNKFSRNAADFVSELRIVVTPGEVAQDRGVQRLLHGRSLMASRENSLGNLRNRN